MNKQTLLDLVQVVREYGAGLVPGALGAAVSVATQGAMTWTQRFIQFTVGIIVSYYAGEIAGYFGLTDVVKSGVGFVAGIGAYEVVKHLRVSMGKVAEDAPTDVWSAIKRKFGLS